MLLRMLQGPGTGRPSRGTRLLAVLVAGGLLAASAPVLIPFCAWLVGLL